jgi:hypothetical protein
MSYSNLAEYIERLRLHLGDTDSTAYRYIDIWLSTALYAAVEVLMPRWNYKYLITEATNLVYRNPASTFLFPEPPIIERGDIWPIILQASIIIKEGSLENSSWNFASWRDAEISYSNLESSRSKDASLLRDIEMLDTMLPWRAKRLAGPIKGHLPGYLRNEYEHD